jgi:hypothetical protein
VRIINRSCNRSAVIQFELEEDTFKLLIIGVEVQVNINGLGTHWIVLAS